MKYSLTFFTVCLFLNLTSCQSSDNAQEMLQDESGRQQVYATILEDEQMRNELMAVMRDRNMGAGMMHSGGMVGDTAGTARLHRQQMQLHLQQLTTLCETDSATCQEMALLMIQNQTMMRHVMARMQQQGIIDSTCLQQMRARMKQ